MTQHPLPAWPEMPAPSVLYSAAYERAMKEAYAARLRVACDVMDNVDGYLVSVCEHGASVADYDRVCVESFQALREALAIIGPLPEQKEVTT